MDPNGHFVLETPLNFISFLVSPTHFKNSSNFDSSTVSVVDFERIFTFYSILFSYVHNDDLIG